MAIESVWIVNMYIKGALVQLGDWISDYQGRQGEVLNLCYDDQLDDFVLTVRTSYGVDIDLLGANLTFVDNRYEVRKS